MGRRDTIKTMVVWGIAGLLVTVGVAGAEDWPCWRGPRHDGKSQETGLLKAWPAGGPKLKWQAKGLGKGFSTVSVSDGAIYTSGDVGGDLVLFSFDMAGKPRWRKRAAGAWTRSHPGSRSTPTIEGAWGYVLSGNGEVVCFATKDGAVRWTKDLREMGGKPGGWGYAESVLIQGEKAIVKPGGENCIVALNKANGEVIWQSRGFRAGPEYSSCVPMRFGGAEILATGSREGIVAVSAADGKVLWNNRWSRGNTANCPDPAFAEGLVFWANGYGKGGICLKLEGTGAGMTAKEAWTTREMDCHHGGYIIHEGYIYGNHGRGWSCLALKTGKRQWNERAVGKGSVTYADGMLYLFGERGGKAALGTCSPGGLEIKGEVTVEGEGPSWAHPVVSHGCLFLRYGDNLYCFDIKAG